MQSPGWSCRGPTPVVMVFIFICAIAVRSILIAQPFLDSWSWRQADDAMIARNFFLGGYHILYPQVDWSADTTGVVGTEFPFLSFLAALLYKLFGIHEWVGRGLTVAFFTLSLPYFFGVVAKISNRHTALIALVFYAFAPVSIFASRSFMPDAVALTLSVLGLYHFLAWLDSTHLAHLALASLFVTGSMLIKAPYAMILLPILYACIEKFGFAAFRSGPLWMFAI